MLDLESLGVLIRGAAEIVAPLAGRQDLLAVEIFKKRKDGAPVAIIGDTTSVIALGSEVLQRFEWGIRRGLYHQMQLSHGYPTVGVIEVVVAVPSKRPVHAPFTDNCVEEGERQKQRLPNRPL